MEAASAESSRLPFRGGAGFPPGQVSPSSGLHAVLGREKVPGSGGAPPWLLTMLTKWVQHARLETRTKETCAVASVWVENSSAERR